MKKLLLALLPVTAFATGVVTTEPQYEVRSHKYGAKLGLKVEEPLLLNGLAFDGWLGLGKTWEQDHYTDWASAKVGVKYTFDCGLGLGLFNQPDVDFRHGKFQDKIEATVSYQVW